MMILPKQIMCMQKKAHLALLFKLRKTCCRGKDTKSVLLGLSKEVTLLTVKASIQRHYPYIYFHLVPACILCVYDLALQIYHFDN